MPAIPPLLLLLALALFCRDVFAAPVQFLPLICTETTVQPGAAVTACPSNKQKYDYALPTDLVRWCQSPQASTGQCAYDQLKWARYSVLDNSQLVDACKEPGQEPGTLLEAGNCNDWDQVQKGSLPITDYFTGAPLSGKSPLPVLLRWNVSNVSNCVASGGWTGNKGSQGEQTVTVGLSTGFGLRCEGTSTTEGQATVSWTPPTQNVDGTPLTTLAGYRILYGTQPTVLTQVIGLNDPTLKSYVVGPLPAPQQYYFAIRAVNSVNAESENSNVAGTTVQPKQGKIFNQTVTVTVTGGTPVPKAPTATSATSVNPAPASTQRQPKAAPRKPAPVEKPGN